MQAHVVVIYQSHSCTPFGLPAPSLPLAPHRRRLLVDSHLECWSGELVGCLAPCPPYLLPTRWQRSRFRNWVNQKGLLISFYGHVQFSSTAAIRVTWFLNSSAAAASSSNPINRLVITNQKLLLLRLNGFYIHLSLSLSLFLIIVLTLSLILPSFV